MGRFEFLPVRDRGVAADVFDVLEGQWGCDANVWFPMDVLTWTRETFARVMTEAWWLYLVIIDGKCRGIVVVAFEENGGELRPFLHFWNAPGLPVRVIISAAREFISWLVTIHPVVLVYNITRTNHYRLYRWMGFRDVPDTSGLFQWATPLQRF